MNTAPKDLIVLVADRNMEAAVRGILARHQALGIRALSFDIRRHPQRDSGCRVGGVDFLSIFPESYHNALLIFDHEGCGQEATLPETMETNLKSDLRGQWGDRAAAVVIAPELDVWVWADSPHVADCLGWKQESPDLKSWLLGRNYLAPDQSKPDRPKEALEAVLRETRRPRTSTLYQDIAAWVSFTRCSDRAFGRLKTLLQGWFGADARVW